MESKIKLRTKYENELKKLKSEEKYMRLIASHIEDQINRMKVEEIALKGQLQIQENPTTGQSEKEPSPEKIDDVDINAVPLNLNVNFSQDDYNDNNSEEEEEEEEEDDDDDDSTSQVTQLSIFLDEVTKRQQEGM